MSKNRSGFRPFGKYPSVPVSIVCALFGLALLIWPNLSIRTLSCAIGTVLLVFGLYKIIAYFAGDAFAVMQGWSLSIGLIAVLFGVTLYAAPVWPTYIIPLALGGVLVCSGFVKIQVALDFRRMDSARWWVALLFAVLTLAIGVVILFNPFGTIRLLMRFVGAALLFEGVVNLIEGFSFDKKRKSYYPDRF